MRLKSIAIAMSLLPLCAIAQKKADVPGLDSLDSMVTDFMKAWNIAGGEVAIAKNGNLLYNKAFGFSDELRTTPAKADNLYRIASVSKPLTAIAIMHLVEEQKLDLDQKVFAAGGILDQPYYSKVISDKRIHNITVQNLLEHTSGWDRNFPCDGYPHTDPAFFPLHVSQVLHEPNPVGDSAIIKFSLLKGIHHEPGTTYSYSNVGYLVLGKIIEKVTGMSYERFMQDSILVPAGITNMHLGRNLREDRLSDEVEYVSDYQTSSCYGDGSEVPWQYGGFNLEAMNSHGGWIATAADLNKLLVMLGGKSPHKLLAPETVAVMITPGKANPYYAKGWCVNPSHNIWHTGSLDGSASLVCRTADGYTWTLLFNGRGDNSTAFWNALDHLPWSCVETLENSIADMQYPQAGVSVLTTAALPAEE